MIGFGILEFAFIFWGTLYIFNSHDKKDSLEYIQLNQDQFNNLKQTLITNNILPEEMLLNNRIELNSNQIPPSYEDVRTAPIKSNSELEKETEIFDDDVLEMVM
jgi:hypothetical protein